MGNYDFTHTPTDQVPPEKLEEEVQRELSALHEVGIRLAGTGSHRVMPAAMVRMARVLALVARQADIQTRRVVRLTWALVILTIALFLFTAYLTYDAYEKGHGTQHTDPHAAQKP